MVLETKKRRRPGKGDYAIVYLTPFSNHSSLSEGTYCNRKDEAPIASEM